MKWLLRELEYYSVGRWFDNLSRMIGFQTMIMNEQTRPRPVLYKMGGIRREGGGLV